MRSDGRQLSDMQQFVFNIVNSILPNVLSSLPFGLQTGFSSFFKTSLAFHCIRFLWPKSKYALKQSSSSEHLATLVFGQNSSVPLFGNMLRISFHFTTCIIDKCSVSQPEFRGTRGFLGGPLGVPCYLCFNYILCS